METRLIYKAFNKEVGKYKADILEICKSFLGTLNNAGNVLVKPFDADRLFIKESDFNNFNICEMTSIYNEADLDPVKTGRIIFAGWYYMLCSYAFAAMASIKAIEYIGRNTGKAFKLDIRVGKELSVIALPPIFAIVDQDGHPFTFEAEAFSIRLPDEHDFVEMYNEGKLDNLNELPGSGGLEVFSADGFVSGGFAYHPMSQMATAFNKSFFKAIKEQVEYLKS